MHPHFVQALARERRAEILRAQRFRDSGPDGEASYGAPSRRPHRPLRRSVGSFLVVAGTRLMAPRPADYALQASPDRTLR